MAQRRQQQELEDRNRKSLLDILATWDDDEKIERGRDYFYSDRCAITLTHTATDKAIERGGALNAKLRELESIKTTYAIVSWRRMSKKRLNKNPKSS